VGIPGRQKFAMRLLLLRAVCLDGENQAAYLVLLTITDPVSRDWLSRLNYETFIGEIFSQYFYSQK